MSLSETKDFLEDLVIRFDPTLDLEEGSRVQTELIEPILARVGGDPFDDDITTFIRTRIQEVYPNLAITEADELTDLLIDPMRVLLEPIAREIKLAKLRMSLRNIDSLSDDEVDALMANFFEGRRAGGFSVGVVRAYFAQPQTISVTLVHLATSRGGLRFTPTRAQQITADQMLLNMEGSEYYVDFNFTAEKRGTEYDIEPGEIISIANLPTSTRVKNIRRFRGGVARESNAVFAARVQQGTSDKTLTTRPGIVAVLNDNFPELRQVFEVGFGDTEMQRDVIKGGSLGSIPTEDTLGSFFGIGSPQDDLDADLTTSHLNATTGNFVSRIGAVGSAPSDWYLSLSYFTTGFVLNMADVKILQVLSDTLVKIDYELPLEIGTDSVIWALRKRALTISDIPGGVVLPDTIDGNLEISSDKVHIGGKTDIYIAGGVEDASSQIIGLSDELPLVRGLNAQTQGGSVGNEDLVILNDDGGLFADIVPGMSLILSEGADAGAYRILEVLTSPNRVRLNSNMTGTQANLSWKVVDEINVDLVVPKDILAEGADLLMGAGSDVVSTSSSFNFVDAGLSIGDILDVDAEIGGGEFTITEVNAVTIKIEPLAPRTLSGVGYTISRRSEGVVTPVLRIRTLELLDASGSPNGTTIPYRDPVLVTSNAFQNEGSGYLYDGPALSGLVSVGFTGSLAVGTQTVNWTVFDPDRMWDAAVHTGSFTFSGGSKSVSQMVTELNASVPLQNAGVRAVALSYGGNDYLGFTCIRHFRITSGSALTLLGIAVNASNCQVRGVPGVSFTALKVRRGDLVEFTDGNNAGAGVRIITDPTLASDVAISGYGPLGPAGTTALYNNQPLNPDAGGRVRIARPSVGSARAYFLSPTSAEFRYAETRFTVELNGQLLTYRPDPENTRTLMPPPPSTDLPNAATSDSSSNTLSDPSSNFLLLGISAGDLLDVLYVPITGTSPLASVGTIAVGGLTLIVRLGDDPYITVSFPFAMTRDDVVDYINEQVGVEIASLTVGGNLQLKTSERLDISSGSTALGVLFISTLSSDHPSKGTFIVSSASENTLQVSLATPLSGGSVADTHYQVRRYVQRISSTEMNLNVDASGLYYATVEAVSTLPGDRHNIGNQIELAVTGHHADGYRLSTDNETTSFSRAEGLDAQLSRTLLLVGSSDSPEEYVQLSGQNVQVTYERSPLVDDIQSFCNSVFRRVLCEEILVRHLLPHYVSVNWSYAGGSSEPDMTRAISDALDAIEGGQELEVGDLTDLLRRRGATSVYTPDTEATNGRNAPLLLVVRHESDRRVRASLVRDVVTAVRTQRYLPDSIALKRLSSSGLR
jgi:hypothetical protein